MLPDFPRIKRHLEAHTSRLIRHMVKQHPMLGQIQSRTVFEGNRTGIEEADSKRDTPMERVVLPMSMERGEVVRRGFDVVLEQVPTIATGMIVAQLKMLVRGVTESVERTGNAVHASGAPFDQELYLKALATVQMQFDADGKPHIPSLFHPDPALQARTDEKLRQWMADPSFRERLEAVITRQREEWDDRESNRALAD